MTERTKVAGLILAAGRSRRMGRPKALLDAAGETFLGRLARVAGEAGLAPLRIVVGEEREAFAARHPELAESFVVNEELDLGQLHSLRLGLRSLPEEVEAMLVLSVDRPLIATATLRSLADAFARQRAPVALPAHGGRRGHPALFARELFAELEAAPLEGGARTVVRAQPERVLTVEVDDPAIHQNIDTPEDYARLSGDA